MSSFSPEILEFIKRFPLNGKEKFNWDISHKTKIFESKNDFSENDSKKYIITSFYLGIDKNNEQLFVKEFNLENWIELKIIKQLLKEIYFNFTFKMYKYFQKEINILLSDDEKYLFFVFKGNTISLTKLINTKKYNYKEKKNAIKAFIYQITFGLYILHKNNIIHHDIKPSNILIDGEGNIFICDFGSAIFKGEHSFSSTLYYTAPDFLIDKYHFKIDEKFDIWSLGVVILELYFKKCNIFSKDKKKEKNIKENEEEKKNFLFLKFGVKDYKSKDDLKNFKINENILNQIKDNEIKNLIENLLVLNPEKRYTAEEILLKFFKDYLNVFGDSFEIDKIKYPFDYKEIEKNIIDKKKFIELIKKMI